MLVFGHPLLRPVLADGRLLQHVVLRLAGGLRAIRDPSPRPFRVRRRLHPGRLRLRHARRRPRGHADRALLAFGTVITLGPVTGLAAALVMVLTIWIPSPWLAALCFFLIGAGPMLWVISTTTLRQAVTPSHALGRVSAIMVTATSGSRPVGAAIGALVGATYGAETCIVVAALGFLVQAALILTSPVPHLARQPEVVG